MISRKQLTSYLLSILALSATPISAQNLLGGSPACAQQCAALVGSNDACSVNVDPNTCFCDANAALPSQSTTFCADGCTDTASQQQLVKWFVKQCPMFAPTSTAPVTTATSTPGAPAPTTPAGSTPKGNGYSGGHHGSGHHSGKSTWWDKHAKWIAMVIVLIIGFSIIIAVGIFFKKRYDKKHNRASNVPDNAVWGPNTSQFQTSTISEEGYGEGSQETPPMRERSSYDRSRSKRSSRNRG